MWIFNVLLTQLDKGNAVLMALLDLSAAFDTVDHTILKRRLQMTHGIDGKALEWVASYLSNRTMRVCVDGEYSHDLSWDVSLPQGSQLGPRFYSDYTQPMGRLIRIIELLFSGFADDTQLLKPVTSPADIPSALEHLSNGIRRIGTWMYDNKLKLNPDKTEFLIITSQRNQPKYDVQSLALDDEIIARSATARNLGVTIDSELNLENHIANMVKTCYFYIRWLRNIRPYISEAMAKSLVHALVLSRIDYCNGILVGLPKKQLRKLQMVMNTAARLISGKRKYDSITETLIELHWLPVIERCEYKVLLMVFKSLNNIAPVYIKDLVKLYQSCRRLRSTDKLLLEVPRFRTKYGERSFMCMAPRLWNDLPFELRSITELSVFKRSLKTHLFRKAYF